MYVFVTKRDKRLFTQKNLRIRSKRTIHTNKNLSKGKYIK